MLYNLNTYTYVIYTICKFDKGGGKNINGCNVIKNPPLSNTIGLGSTNVIEN